MSIRVHRSSHPTLCDNCESEDRIGVEIVAGECPNFRRLTLCPACAQLAHEKLDRELLIETMMGNLQDELAA